MNTRKIFNIKTMAKISFLAAIAFILMYFDFPIPFLAPTFYKIDFSEVAVLMGGFALGPLAAMIIEGLKIVLYVLFKGTGTAYVGEFANFLIGCALVVPASYYYQRNKCKKNAIIGLVMGSILMTIMGLILNYYVLIPAYSTFFGLDLDTIIKMGAAIIPIINNKLMFVLLATTPFNIVKAIAVSVFTLLLYKHISPILKKWGSNRAFFYLKW